MTNKVSGKCLCVDSVSGLFNISDNLRHRGRTSHNPCVVNGVTVQVVIGGRQTHKVAIFAERRSELGLDKCCNCC